MTERPALVCITPARNEAWVLERFLAAAETWADVIVLLDQMSTDGSREIAAAHPRVVMIDNPIRDYDDGANRRLLLKRARELVSEPRIIISLDADEALTADATEQAEWTSMLSAAPGTVIRMKWVNVLPDDPRGWLPPHPIVFGLVDDGSPYEPPRLHPPRLPTGAQGPGGTLDLEQIKVIHLQYLDWEQMRSKQRWYQAWERANMPSRRPIQIYRRYHHMNAIHPSERRSLMPGWTEGYTRRGIDLLASEPRPAYRWDEKVIEMVQENGGRHFRRVDIWDVDWQGKADALGRELPDAFATDPRTWWDRRVLSWLARTQSESQDMRIRWVQRALRLTGW